MKTALSPTLSARLASRILTTGRSTSGVSWIGTELSAITPNNTIRIRDERLRTSTPGQTAAWCRLYSSSLSSLTPIT